MAKSSSKSTLQETDFSSYNLRDAYINESIELLAALRDEALFSNWGIKVLIRMPAKDGKIISNNVDEYNNFVNIEWIDVVETVVPKFNDYRISVSDEGMTADGTTGIYPLEILLPTKLFCPRDSRIILSEHDAYENKIAREWVVLSTQMKQLSGSKTYTQIADCVPARKETFNSANTNYLSEFWFEYNIEVPVKASDIRAQGMIWFLRDGVPRDRLVLGKRYDETYEQMAENSQYAEYVRIPVYYDNRNQNLVNTGTGFAVGDEYELYDDDGNQLYVIIDDEENIRVPLSIKITEAGNNGEILGFKYNVERGYTLFGKDGVLQVTIADAILNINCIDINNYTYQETITNLKVSSPKYIYPQNKIAKFSAKRIAISVLI